MRYPGKHRKVHFLVIIFLITILCFFLMAGCRLGKGLVTQKANSDILIHYHLRYNNRSPNHRPAFIYVTVETKAHRTFYQFSLDSQEVTKYQSVDKGNYLLAFDLKDQTNASSVIGITNIEDSIFQKIIFLTDSLKLQNYKLLNSALGFYLTKSGKYYSDFKSK